MVVTDAQVRKVREEMAKHGKIGVAAARAGMDRKTARKYLATGELPSESTSSRTWRTRRDPFAEDWPTIEAWLEDDPDAEAVMLLEELMELHPDRYHEGQVRTLQRKLRRWRAEHGPDKPVFFPQRHRPGEAMQTDFTWATELGVTIRGEPLDHMLCHPVLPYSNWEWCTVCRSESLAALKRGVQEALRELGKSPAAHQTDHSTAATHRVEKKKREFNKDYVAFVEHYGMEPRTIAVGKKEQNGDVESLNGSCKRRLRRELKRRGSSDFDSVLEYEQWVQQVLRRRNRRRRAKVAEELAVMKPLPPGTFPEYCEVRTRVLSWSTISIRKNVYSVPPRLIGEMVKVRIYDDRIEVYFAEKRQLVTDRLQGEGGHRINYRHVVRAMVRKPGAFERYRYRDDLFPSETFRWAHERLRQQEPGRRADLEYLRLLKLAADTMESDVEAAIAAVQAKGEALTFASVEARVLAREPELPALTAPEVSLESYDELLEEQVEDAA